MRLAFQIAVRFLSSSKSQTILIALGIAIGISVQIFIGSLISGLQKSLVDTTIGNAAQISIVSDADNRLIEKYEPIADAARRREPRLTAISPVLDQPGLIIDGDRSNSILMRGFDFTRAEEVYEFSERLLVGRLPERDSHAVIGVDLARELGVQPGDSIEVTVLGNIRKSFTVVGIFDSRSRVLTNPGFWSISRRSRIYLPRGML